MESEELKNFFSDLLISLNHDIVKIIEQKCSSLEENLTIDKLISIYYYDPFNNHRNFIECLLKSISIYASDLNKDKIDGVLILKQLYKENKE